MSEIIRMTEARIPAMADTVQQLQENVQQLGGILSQMGRMMAAMQMRLDELESRERQATASHEEVKHLMVLIRLRADEWCEKYALDDAGSVKAARAAIKKDVLSRYGVKDLHDVPAIALQAVEAQISRWTSIRLAMDRRAAGSC